MHTTVYGTKCGVVYGAIIRWPGLRRNTARFRAVSHRKRPYTVKLRLKIRLSVIIDQGNDYFWKKQKSFRLSFTFLFSVEHFFVILNKTKSEWICRDEILKISMIIFILNKKRKKRGKLRKYAYSPNIIPSTLIFV